jgi:hypothetical protein
VPNKLAVIGFELDPSGRPAGSTPDDSLRCAVERDIELLAEIEHGRFTSERLLSGWTSGVRDPARFLSPHLRPWSELDEETREYDREVVRDLPWVLASHGLHARRLER